VIVDGNSETLAVRVALVSLFSLGVGIAVTAALLSANEPWFEAVLTGAFCGLPVFLLGVWLAARNDV
jgi:hypothetical protein